MNRESNPRSRSKYNKRRKAVLPRSKVSEPVKRPVVEPELDISQIWRMHDNAKHLPRFPRLEGLGVKSKTFIKNLSPKQALMLSAQAIVVIAALTVIASWVHPNTKSDSSQNITIVKPSTAAQGVKGTNTDSSNSALDVESAPVQEPDFTTYYPANLPKQLSVDKSSIDNNADNFSFRVGTTKDDVNFFVSEQSATEKFSFDNLRNSLGNPQEYNIFIGKAVTGKYKDGTATGILTKDKTLILINCAGYNCEGNSKALANSLQINTDKSLYKKK